MQLGVINKGLCKHPRHLKAPHNYKSNIIKHKFKKYTAGRQKYYCRTLALKADPGLFPTLWFINFTCGFHTNIILGAEQVHSVCIPDSVGCDQASSACPTCLPEDSEELARGVHELFSSALFEKYPKCII